MSKHGDIWTSPGGEMELRCGKWQDVLADVTACDAVITDPPYSEETHHGHDYTMRPTGGLDKSRSQISYSSWSDKDIEGAAASWCAMSSSWVVALSDDRLAQKWRHSFGENGLVTFQSLPCIIHGMTVRMSGDGPSSWAVYAVVARKKSAYKWGTLPGAYTGGRGDRCHIGGKPLWLMRAIVKDYSRPGDLIVDPCAGGGTTLLAAAIEGRRAIGAEMDPETFDKAVKRLSKGYTPSMFTGIDADTREQAALDLGA